MDAMTIRIETHVCIGDIIILPISYQGKIKNRKFRVVDVTDHLVVLNNGTYNTAISRTDLYYHTPIEASMRFFGD